MKYSIENATCLKRNGTKSCKKEKKREKKLISFTYALCKEQFYLIFSV